MVRKQHSVATGRIVAAVFACIALICAVTVRHSPAQDADLSAAMDAYYGADYDLAIRMFSEIARNEAADRTERKESLEYLGRSYVAKNLMDEARNAVIDLLELEPPLVELDVDRVPPQLMRLYYDERRRIEDSYAVEREDPGLSTLAVIDFTNSSIYQKSELDPLQWGFASMMINSLNGATDLKVIERERIAWLLDELEMQRDPDLIDQGSAVRIGRLLGATAVLIGNYTATRREMMISARLVKVETGEILMAEQVRGRQNRFFDLIERLSLQVARAINVNLDQRTLNSRRETRSLDAWLSYSQGLQLLENGDYRAAYEKFIEAARYDPKFTRAEVKAESIRPMLAAG